MALGMLAVGLWPFDYLPRNDVAWLEGENGIRFTGRGQVIGSQAAPLTAGEGFTLEILLRPARSFSDSLPNILTLCDRRNREVLDIGQWKNDLVVDLFDPGAWRTHLVAELGASGILFAGRTALITLVSGQGGTVIYSDGVPVQEYEGLNLASALGGTPIHSLVLGNSSSGDSPWQGEILGMSLANRAIRSEEVILRHVLWGGTGAPLDDGKGDEEFLYLFDQREGHVVKNLAGDEWDLLVPGALIPLRRALLSWPSSEFLFERSLMVDILVNILGFAPMGAALTLYFAFGAASGRRHSVILIPVLIGGAFSLFVEVNQAFLVSRDSSLLDLILNTIGTAGGGMIAKSFFFQFKSGTRSARHGGF